LASDGDDHHNHIVVIVGSVVGGAQRLEGWEIDGVRHVLPAKLDQRQLSLSLAAHCLGRLQGAVQADRWLAKRNGK